MEIDQQTYVAAAQADVGKQLRLVDGINGFDALDFDDDEVFDDQIDAIAQIDALSVIDYGESYLPRNGETLFAKFVGQAGFVGALEEAGAQLRMNLHRGCDHCAGQAVDARGGDHGEAAMSTFSSIVLAPVERVSL